MEQFHCFLMGWIINKIYCLYPAQSAEHATLGQIYKGSSWQASIELLYLYNIYLCSVSRIQFCSVPMFLLNIISEVVQQFAGRWSCNAIYGRLWRQSDSLDRDWGGGGDDAVLNNWYYLLGTDSPFSSCSKWLLLSILPHDKISTIRIRRHQLA